MNPPACVECKFYKSAGLQSPACDHPDHQPPDSYDIVTGKEIIFGIIVIGCAEAEKIAMVRINLVAHAAQRERYISPTSGQESKLRLMIGLHRFNKMTDFI